MRKQEHVRNIALFHIQVMSENSIPGELGDPLSPFLGALQVL